MKHEENTNLYYAEDGNTIVRKSDGFNMGWGLCLSESDSIDNYEEREMTEDEKAEYEAEMTQFRPQNNRKNIKK